jgi:excisionase family DNA binding protein
MSDGTEQLNGKRSPATPRSLMTADEVAELLGVTRAWIYEQSRAGRMPHVKLGRYYRYRIESLDEWMDELERCSVREDNKMAGRRSHAPGPA